MPGQIWTNKRHATGRLLTALWIVAGLCAFTGRPLQAESTIEEHRLSGLQARVDSLFAFGDILEQKVLASLFHGASAPVAFSGEARLRGQFHDFAICPGFLGPRKEHSVNIPGDRSYLETGWEESSFRLGMIVHPHRSLTLWTKLGFYNSMPGNRLTFNRTLADYTLRPGFSHRQVLHSGNGRVVNVYEDMNAGFAIRTAPASFWLRLGSINWIEASPLSVWKAQPRMFAWEYLPYEENQPISEYYAYNIARGEKTGRAAWHKKAFSGLHFESITLPLDLEVTGFVGTGSNYDVFEREYFDMAIDLGYAADEGVNTETGIGDSYRHVIIGRLARPINPQLKTGITFNTVTTSPDIIYASDAKGPFFNRAFRIGGFRNAVRVPNTDTPEPDDSLTVSYGSGFFKTPHVLSLDLAGNLSRRLSILADVSISRLDTTWIVSDSMTTLANSPIGIKETYRRSGPIIPAVYANIRADLPVTFETDLAFIPRGFYAPFSFVSPMDGFYPFGANLLGAGTFAGKTEASPYTQNMTGVQLTMSPKLKGNGHLKVKYGQHLQLQAARDVLYFPYRLNGMDLNSTLQSNYHKWGYGLIDDGMLSTIGRPDVRYRKRLGDESYKGAQFDGESGPQAGGIRADYLSIFESFVPFKDSIQAYYNSVSIYDPPGPASPTKNEISSLRQVIDTVNGIPDTIFSDNGFLPVHRKYTFNLELDAAYDFGPLVGYPRNIYLGGYAAINGITTSFVPLALNDKGSQTLLWSLYVRAEPAIALTKKFYLLGLVGFENWRSQKSWMNTETTINAKPVIKHVPIDYRDVAFGLGFDWDMLDFVGLHVRAKWFGHYDINCPANDYRAVLASAEIKTFF